MPSALILLSIALSGLAFYMVRSGQPQAWALALLAAYLCALLAWWLAERRADALDRAVKPTPLPTHLVEGSAHVAPGATLLSHRAARKIAVLSLVRKVQPQVPVEEYTDETGTRYVASLEVVKRGA